MTTRKQLPWFPCTVRPSSSQRVRSAGPEAALLWPHIIGFIKARGHKTEGWINRADFDADDIREHAGLPDTDQWYQFTMIAIGALLNSERRGKPSILQECGEIIRVDQGVWDLYNHPDTIKKRRQRKVAAMSRTMGDSKGQRGTTGDNGGSPGLLSRDKDKDKDKDKNPEDSNESLSSDAGKPPPKTPDPVTEAEQRIIAKINDFHGWDGKYAMKGSRNLRQRLREGAEENDLFLVWEWAHAVWRPDFSKKPATLWGKNKFPQYLRDADAWNRRGRPERNNNSKPSANDWMAEVENELANSRR